MNSQKLNEFQNEMDTMFKRKVTMRQEITRLGAIDVFYLKLTVYGLPVEVKAYGQTIEEAEELVLSKYFDEVNKALKEDLFPTQDKDQYQPVELTESDASDIFSKDDCLPKEVLANYLGKTTAKMTKLPNGKYECVIENEACNIHARAACTTEERAKKYAIMTARKINEPDLIELNREVIWKVLKN